MLCLPSSSPALRSAPSMPPTALVYNVMYLHLEGAERHHRPHLHAGRRCSAPGFIAASAPAGAVGLAGAIAVGAAVRLADRDRRRSAASSPLRRASLAAQHAGARDHGPAGGGAVVGHRAEAVPAPHPAGLRRRICDQKYWLPMRRRRCHGARASSSSIAARCSASCSSPCPRTPSRRGRAASPPTGSGALSYVLSGALGGAGRLRRRAADLRLLRARPGADPQRLHRAWRSGGLGSNLGALIGGAGARPAQRLRHLSSSAASTSRRSRSAC